MYQLILQSFFVFPLFSPTAITVTTTTYIVTSPLSSAWAAGEESLVFWEDLS